MDIDGYKIVNIYKPLPTQLRTLDLPVFPHPCLYTGDFNCCHADWGYDDNSLDGECLADWASINCLALLYNAKDAASFYRALPAELCQMGATLSLAYHGSLDPDHILHGLLSGLSDTGQVRLRSRCSFVPGAQNLLDNLARLGICASEWTNHKWKTEYCENASRLCAFVPETGARPVGMGLPRAAWVRLNRLWTGVGRFHLSMHKWGLAPSPNCECGASEQTADHVY